MNQEKSAALFPTKLLEKLSYKLILYLLILNILGNINPFRAYAPIYLNRFQCIEMNENIGKKWVKAWCAIQELTYLSSSNISTD